MQLQGDILAREDQLLLSFGAVTKKSNAADVRNVINVTLELDKLQTAIVPAQRPHHCMLVSAGGAVAAGPAAATACGMTAAPPEHSIALCVKFKKPEMATEYCALFLEYKESKSHSA